MNVSTAYDNLILRALSPPDLALLSPHLEPVQLPVCSVIEKPDTPIEHVYFLETGIASTVGFLNPELKIELGIVGREGVTGLPVLLGQQQSPYATVIQVAGGGLRLPAERLRDAIADSASLQQSLLRYVHAFMTQVSSTALANGRTKLEPRLARWILMVHDRQDGHKLMLTHEFLAMMLGVRRPGLTVALQILEGRGLVKGTRGQIHVLNRPELVTLAGGCYGVPESEYLRLTGFALSRDGG